MNVSLSTNLFPGAVPNNHTPPDDDIERNLCAELFVVVDLAHFIIIIIFFFCDLNLRFLNLRVHWTSFHSHISCELFCFMLIYLCFCYSGYLPVVILMLISLWHGSVFDNCLFCFFLFFVLMLGFEKSVTMSPFLDFWVLGVCSRSRSDDFWSILVVSSWTLPRTIWEILFFSYLAHFGRYFCLAV